MRNMWLPSSQSVDGIVEFTDVSSFVIIGANGSGKSRLGAWIDALAASDAIVHRVSAHRALVIPDYIQPRPLEQAARLLVIGVDHPSYKYNSKTSHRWQSNPLSHLLNDFEYVISLLFAEHFKRADEFREQCRASSDFVPPIVESRLETVGRIWNDVMPQRRILIKDNQVSAQIDGSNFYAGKEMSDGEKVALYLIAQCVAAPLNAIIVLDEPELHLHRSIHARLWDSIELARPDCIFVYITHDLSFAESRVMAKKIWVQSYDGEGCWSWQEVPQVEHLPERLLLQILGSRKPILFVEGENSSLDVAVYRALFPERLVIPRNSCKSVVDSTSALRTLQHIHHTEAYGIIDRDHRSETEVAALIKTHVHVPAVAEIENLFLIPEAIEHASAHLKRSPPVDLASVQDFLFGELRKEFAVQVNDRATFLIQQRLNSFAGPRDRKGGAAEFRKAVEDYLAPINCEKIHAECESLFSDILARRDYSALLRHYNRKSLASRVSRNLGLADGEYPSLILRLLQIESGAKLRSDMRLLMPSIA